MKLKGDSGKGPDATQETEYGNRSTMNQYMEDGRILVSSSGTEYQLKKQYSKLREVSKFTKREVAAYSVIRISDGKIIGSVTSYTTDNRLFSLIERREKPEAMLPVEFISKISGSPSMIYIVVRHEREWANIRYDDTFDIEITTKDGRTYGDLNLHLSLIKATPVINISRMKRILREKDPEGKNQYLSIPAYNKLSDQERREELALLPGDLVKVKLTPCPTQQEFFFADNL